MIYKNILPLLISSLLFTHVITTKGQDTLKLDTLQADTLHHNYDSMKVQEDCHDIMIEQRTINTELKRQLDFLRNILDEEEKKKDPNK